uniref:RELT like 2 n=1 Tax=Mola mola TaxID=94237 RepID=A0A3Q3XBB8_MOLML
MTELEASGKVEHPPPYIIFVVVFLFFLTGLLGFLICHLLKKKGYRCRTGEINCEEEEEEDNEENQDTVEQILKCIIENEGTEHNSCHLCAQVRSKKGRRQSRTPRLKQRPGEQTVFSVGRFVTSVTYLKKGDNDSIAFSIKEQELDGARLPKAEEKTERSRVGILKTAKLSELEGNSSAFAFSSPTEEYSKDRLSSFPLPSSPLGSRISNVAIIKASPDSKREFSVVTMVEEEESSSSTKDQKRETSQLRIESGKAEIDSTVSDVVQPEIEHGENSATQDKQPASQEKDDMVEMEDIKDCKVTQMEETKLVDE